MREVLEQGVVVFVFDVSCSLLEEKVPRILNADIGVAEMWTPKSYDMTWAYE